MYKYYQIGPHSQWEVIPNNADTEQNALNAGARKLTILAVSQIISDDTSRENDAYAGRWYSDIDAKDIAEAILSAQLLVSKLLDLGVVIAAIYIYASGSKGFHIEVVESVFSTGRPMKNLPAIYKEMALSLYVPGMDFQVYSGGRGVCWRLPNLVRDDGKYKVPITYDELYEMTPEMYAQVTSTARIIPKLDLDPSLKAHGLEALMESSKKRVRSRPAQPEPVPEAKLIPFKEDPPPCITELAEYRIKTSKNFNEVALQFGIFIARSGMEETFSDSLVARLAANGNSQSYSSPRTREDHLRGLVSYLKATPSKTFACNAVRSVMANRPCTDCDLCGAGDEEAEVGEDVGVVERSDGYYVVRAGEPTRISTFVLRATNVFLEESQSGKSTRRVGATIEILRDGEFLGKTNFSETGWVSKSTFKSELKGIGNLAFYGTEDDIQKIKHITLDEDQDMGEVVQVNSAGIHTHRLAGKDVMVYVEPGYSINQFRVRDTHTLVDRLTAPPSIMTSALPPQGDERTSETLRHLFQVNEGFAVSQILGWVIACHLKLHLMQRYSQFPLLSIWGNAGAGKSMTTTLFAWLNGCNYSLHDSAVSMSSITTWAMIRYCSSTTTTPRILEEFNKSKMNIRKYDGLAETMKMAWNGQVIARGALRKSSANGGGGGATVKEIPISAPLLIVSEQAPRMPALQQRSVQVQLNPETIRGKENHFFTAMEHKQDLRQMARALVFSALRTDTAWVEEEMDRADTLLPPVLTDRPRYSYQVILLGLRFMRKVCDDLELGLDPEMEQLEQDLLLNVSEQGLKINVEKRRTEADLVMEDVGTMAQLTINDRATWLKVGTHFIVKGRRIYYDFRVIFTTYKLFKVACRESLVIDNESQLMALLEHEPYFVSGRSIDGAKALKITRPVLELNLDKMDEKGIASDMYG